MGIPIGTGTTGPVHHPKPPKPRPPYVPPDPPSQGNPLHPGSSSPSYGSGGSSGTASLAASRPRVPQSVLIGQQIDAFLAAQGSPLAGFGNIFARVAKKRKLDPLLLPAIAGAESQFGKQVQPGTNNPFGWGPHIPFDSWGQSIRQVGKGLSEGYIQQGLDTIPEIARKWAPIGAGNDPTNLNSNWVRNVSSYYNKLEKAAGAAPKYPGKKGYIPGMEELIYDPMGSWFGGQFTPGAYGGHESHVHVGATNPRFMLNTIRLANRLGLSARENPYTENVDPVHAGTSRRYGDTVGSGGPSMHYASFPGRYGPQNKELGKALDVSGPANLLAQFFNNRLLRGGQQYVPMGSAGGWGGGYSGGYQGAGVYGDPSQTLVSARNNAEWQQAEMNRANAIFGSALGEDSPLGRRRKRKGNNEYIDQLLSNLGV